MELWLAELNSGERRNPTSSRQKSTPNCVRFPLALSPHPTDPRWQGKLISETSLYHFFDAHPRRSPSDNWPRVAIPGHLEFGRKDHKGDLLCEI